MRADLADPHLEVAVHLELGSACGKLLLDAGDEEPFRGKKLAYMSTQRGLVGGLLGKDVGGSL